MRINVAVPENEVTKPILDASLESVTRLNEQLLSEDKVPTFKQGLKQRGIQWAPEPPGQEHFDHAGIVMRRGKGDCDDLAPWHAASLRHTGKDPDARAVVKRSGPRKWHAVVERGNGRIEDPSKAAGMRPGVPHFVNGATVPLIGCGENEVGAYLDMPKLAVRPVKNPITSQVEAWQARADLPWHYSPGKSPTDVAMASLHKSPVASQAIVGALQGAIACGERNDYISEGCLDNAEAIGWLLNGASFNEVAGAFGSDVAHNAYDTVEGLFSKIGKALKKVASPVVKAVTSKAGRGLISMIPGVGPAAATALDMAGPALRKAAKGKGRRRKGKRRIRKSKAFANIRARRKVKLKKRRRGKARSKQYKTVSRKGKKMVICYMPPGA